MLEHFELQDLSFPLLIKDVLESHFTGILFVSHEGYKKGIIFKEGNLCAIQSNRPEELLGEVMVHLGMISQKENEESLSTARIERTKQGVILQERGVIGPQDIKNALRVQLQTRFLDIFSWEEGQVQKITKDHIDTRPGLSARELSTLVQKGIMDNVSFSCVISALSPYADCRPHIIDDDIPSGIGVDVRDMSQHHVSEILLMVQDMPKALLALYCTSYITFEESKHKALIDKLRAILRDIRDRDPFETLGVDPDISEGGLKRAYIKLVKDNHPDTYSYIDDPEVKDLSNEVFTEIQKAYQNALRILEGKPEEKQGMDEALQAELLFSQATEALRTKNYQKSMDLFRVCMKMRPEERIFTESYIKTMFLKWNNTGTGNSLEIKAAIREGVKRFPSSDAIYVIFGWVLKKEGSNRAIDPFRKALQINKNNLDAQREIRLYQMRTK